MNREAMSKQDVFWILSCFLGLSLPEDPANQLWVQRQPANPAGRYRLCLACVARSTVGPRVRCCFRRALVWNFGFKILAPLVSEQASEGGREGGRAWVSEWVRGTEWVSEWVWVSGSEWVSEWVWVSGSEWVSESDIRRLAEHQVPRLPRKRHRQSGRDQGTPGRTSDPLQSIKCHACHAKATGDQGTPGRTSDPLQSTKCRACHAKATGACHAKATGRATETKGLQGVHPTPCRPPSAAPATQKPPAEERRPSEARAYTLPLAEHQVPRLPRKSTSDPLQSTKCRACHAKDTGREAETKGRQGVHPTPCRAPSAAPATQKPRAEQRRPRHPTPCRAPSAAPATQEPPAEQPRPRDARKNGRCDACRAAE